VEAFSRCIEQIPDVVEYRMNRFHATDGNLGNPEIFELAVADLRRAHELEPSNTYVVGRLHDLVGE
jgi:hypothetical protein